MRSEGGRRRGGIVRRHVAWPRFFFSFVGLGWAGLVGAVVVFLLLGENEYAKKSERERGWEQQRWRFVLWTWLRAVTFLLICIFFVVFFFMFLDPPLFSCPSFSSSRTLPSPPPEVIHPIRRRLKLGHRLFSLFPLHLLVRSCHLGFLLRVCISTWRSFLRASRGG